MSRALFCIIALVCASACAAGAQNNGCGIKTAGEPPRIENGDFEAVQLPAPFRSGDASTVPGWTHAGLVGDNTLLWKVGYSDTTGTITKAGHGAQFVALGGGYGARSSAEWTTTISGLAPGSMYQLCFMIANENQDAQPLVITATMVNGSSTGPQSYTSKAAKGYWSNWEEETYVFQATAATAVVKFSVVDQQYDIGLDNVRVGGSNAKPAKQQFTVQQQNGKTAITVDEAVLFDFGKSELKPDAAAVLADIKTQVIDKHPSGKIMVEGHTDDVGGDAYNLQLSKARAESVVAWLTRRGVDPSRMQPQGYGKSRPKVPNTSATNRAKNRRVEINIAER